MSCVAKEDLNILESETDSINQINSEEETKRGRGRPRKYPVKKEGVEKKGRGRPRKYPVSQDSEVKRGRGRPRKYCILEKEIQPSGLYKPTIKKVESGHLLKQMFNYFTKLLIIHNELAKMGGKHEVVFNRLKNLDFQMAEVCKTILSKEYVNSSVEENEIA